MHASLWQDPAVWYSGQYAWSKMLHLLGGEWLCFFVLVLLFIRIVLWVCFMSSYVTLNSALLFVC